MSTRLFRRRIGLASFPGMLPAVLALALMSGSLAKGDEVVLVPGTTVKQAIGGRVRGQVQSESPAEVVVKLGATETSVPTDQILSIRYDGQPATLQLAETRRPPDSSKRRLACTRKPPARRPTDH